MSPTELIPAGSEPDAEEESSYTDLWDADLATSYWRAVQHGITIGLVAFASERGINLTGSINNPNVAVDLLELVVSEFDPETEFMYPFDDSLLAAVDDMTEKNADIVFELWEAEEHDSVETLGKRIGSMLVVDLLKKNGIRLITLLGNLRNEPLAKKAALSDKKK